MTFLRKLPSVKENSEQDSNQYHNQIYTHLSGSVFLVNFTDPDKQLFNVISVFKSHHHRSSV